MTKCPSERCGHQELNNGYSIEVNLCRDCRGDYPGGSNYISKRVLIQSGSELKQYGTLVTDGISKENES